MAMSDPLGDMLSRIRNAQSQGRTAVDVPASKLRKSVLDVLEREGYIRGYATIDRKTAIPELSVELKYHEGEPVIKEIARVSKPGRRVYAKIRDLPKFYGGLGISILSTPKGVMSDQTARTENVGGEVLCRVY